MELLAVFDRHVVDLWLKKNPAEWRFQATFVNGFSENRGTPIMQSMNDFSYGNECETVSPGFRNPRVLGA